jgi:anti-anti-sigma factor
VAADHTFRLGVDGARLRVSGAVDMTVTDELTEALLTLLAHHPVVTVDLGAVTQLQSAGLSVLVGARREAETRGVELRLETTADSAAALVLEMAGLPFDTAEQPG